MRDHDSALWLVTMSAFTTAIGAPTLGFAESTERYVDDANVPIRMRAVLKNQESDTRYSQKVPAK